MGGEEENWIGRNNKKQVQSNLRNQSDNIKLDELRDYLGEDEEDKEGSHDLSRKRTLPPTVMAGNKTTNIFVKADNRTGFKDGKQILVPQPTIECKTNSKVTCRR